MIKIFRMYVAWTAYAGLMGCSVLATRDSQPASLRLLLNLNAGSALYQPGDTVQITLQLRNRSDNVVTVTNLDVLVKDISDSACGLLITKQVASSLTLQPQAAFETELFLSSPRQDDAKVQGIYMRYNIDGRDTTIYQTFFRVSAQKILTTFQIDEEDYKGLSVYKLDGGMSAEYAVEKSAAILSAGIAHSWRVNAPGGGPNHVYGGPDFLIDSVDKTVKLYDSILGTHTSIESVIVAPGIPSVPYLALSLKAPVLPIHFLASVYSVKEVQTILSSAMATGCSAYATLGHDPSVPHAVAWIKLLDLPPPYRDFIKRHHVKTIVVMGATGVTGGETKAKQIYPRDGGQYAPGSVYLMYPGTSADDQATLESKIADLKSHAIATDFTRIADWESGMNDLQMQAIAAYGKSHLLPELDNVVVVSSPDLIDLYDLGTHLAVSLMKKNQALYADGEMIPMGVSFNPYLISHPLYELRMGIVPLLYWQGVPVETTVRRMCTQVGQALSAAFPKRQLNQLGFYSNCTRNFGGSQIETDLQQAVRRQHLPALGLTGCQSDEVWDQKDAITSLVEEKAIHIINQWTAEEYRSWYAQIQPLTVTEIKETAGRLPGIDVQIFTR